MRFRVGDVVACNCIGKVGGLDQIAQTLTATGLVKTSAFEVGSERSTQVRHLDGPSGHIYRLVRRSPSAVAAEFPELLRSAWSDEGNFSVLADILIERGVVKPAEIDSTTAVATEASRSSRRDARDPAVCRDWALFELECAVREWILEELHPETELRFTSVGTHYGLPNFNFIVWANNLEHGVTTLSDRFPMNSIWTQPRLLRVPPASLAP